MQHFKRSFALWFVLQIALPFAAPLQACDLTDLLGTPHQRGAQASPESSTTPPACEVNAFAARLTKPTLSVARGGAAVAPVSIFGVPAFAVSLSLFSSPRVQQTVLRL